MAFQSSAPTRAQVSLVGNVFKIVGRAITGKQGATAQNADCGALAAQALR